MNIAADGLPVLFPIQDAVASLQKNKLEFNHGHFAVQFENSDQGIRQNVIVNEALKKNTNELKVTLKVNDDVTIKKVNEKELLIMREDDKLITYSGLKAWDKNGQHLETHFQTGDHEISWVVNVKDAAYPVTIDPVSNSAAWTAESNNANANYGWAVSTAGDVNNDGYSDVIVGAYTFSNGQASEGRAFVYHGSSSGLSAAANWTFESNQAGANFGFSVANAGDVNNDGYDDVIVGAQNYSNGQANEGRAYIFHGSATGLSATSSWITEKNQAGAFFGISVSTAGDVNNDGYDDVIVGGTFYDNGQADEGIAFIYHGSATGVGSASQATLQADQAAARFGCSVAPAGDVNNDGYDDIIIGAKLFDNGQVDEGKVWAYHGSATGINIVAAWTVEINQASTDFGTCVSTAGDVNNDGYDDVIIGASYYDNGETDEGGSFVYHGSATGLRTTVAWSSESNQVGGKMGNGVANAGDVNGDGYDDVIVGATLYDNGQVDEGNAFIYEGSAIGLNAIQASTVQSDVAGAYFGRFVAGAGDVNGDGFSDVLVGAYLLTNGTAQEGKAFLFYGFSVIILPVNFVSFTTQVRADKVYLKWEEAEVGNNQFVIEHSTDGKRFDSIGSVRAFGAQASVTSFDFTHSKPSTGTNNYRIAVKSVNGNTRYSSIRTVLFESSLKVSLTPNPVSHNSSLRIYSDKTNKVELQIYNAAGILIWRDQVRVNAGFQHVPFQVSGIRSGTYFLKIITNTSSSQIKFIKN